MIEENISQEFKLKNIEETRNYLTELTDQNKFMNRTHKKICKTLSYIEHFPSLAYVVTWCISIYVFASLLSIPTGVASSQ